jgi:predicted alpha/beta superfamily hydrolase
MIIFQTLLMNTIKHVTVVLSFLFSVTTAYSQITIVETPGPSGIKFKSAIDSQEYVLYIQLPEGYANSNKKYPVVYVTDGQWCFNSVLQAYNGYRYDGMVPDLIIVGITWTGDYESSRGRDFTPTHIESFPTSGNAPKFLAVIKNEITRYIDSTYRTEKNEKALYGASLGGLFAVYTLFHEPALFNRYMIISPSLWWENELVFKYEKSFAEKNRTLNAKVFISSGEYEEALDFGNTFNRFSNQVKASKYNGLELESIVLEKMSHAASATAGALRGLPFLYGKPDIMVDSILLDQYTGQYKLIEETLTFTRKGNSLYLTLPEGKVKLCAETTESFYIKGQNGTGQFMKDNKSKVTGYNVMIRDSTLLFKKMD